ncbi:MAG: site-specific DNA-methyltransferase [Bacteroidales bacterium]|nr:site-specific DNA-methyltransferase [Bacteroidales bacterium]
MNRIEVFNLSNLPTAPPESFLDLQEDFKIPDPEKNMKLQLLIISRGFKYSFKAWQDQEGKLWIIDAHQRKLALIALRKRGFDVPEVPYELIQAKDKREAVEEIAAYNSEFAKRNPDTQLFEKYNIGTDDLEQFNLKFSAEELDQSVDKMNLFQERFEIVEDDIPELNEKSVFTKPGDIFLLGKHRLVCGDATRKEDVNRLMDGHRADLVITDPPYNVNYEGGTEEGLTIQNDHMSDPSFEEFLRKAYSFMYQLLKDGSAIYVFHSDSEGYAFRKGFKEVGFKLAQCCIWVKNSLVMGRQDYQWQHEPVLYGWKPTGSHSWYADRKQTTIWQFDRPVRSDVHPTMKPVALIAYPMQNSSVPGGIVVDLFAGSGSMIMAAEQTSRRGFALELDPVYCDVIVKRYHAFNNSEDIRLIRDGKYIEWDDLKSELL